MLQFLPSLLNTLGIISPSWIDLPAALAHLQQLGHDTSAILNLHDLKQFVLDNQLDEDQFTPFMGESRLYFVASRYLLPASLVLLTLSIDLKEVLGLGPKALIMFFTATIGVVLGGPLVLHPDTLVITPLGPLDVDGTAGATLALPPLAALIGATVYAQGGTTGPVDLGTTWLPLTVLP